MRRSLWSYPALRIAATLLGVSIAGIAAAQPYGLDTRANSAMYLGMSSTEQNVPALLSLTGAFDNTPALTPKPGLIPYTVNTPFWSDGAVKTRWIALPYDSNVQDNPKIAFTNGEWTFPDGTVFVKHFELVINEQTGEKRRLETRLIVRKAGGYVYGRSYKWRPDGTDADVVNGATDEVIDITGANGVVRQQTWTYPSPGQCIQCHTQPTGGVLGVKTRQQNGDFQYPSTGRTDNQIRTWGHLGMFDGTYGGEGTIASLPKLAALGDTTRPLLDRVRSYIDSNCAQCHRPGGGGPVYDGRYDTPINQQNIFGSGASPVTNVLLRMDAAGSHLLQRDGMTSGAGGMPPIAKNTIDTTWINTAKALVEYPFDIVSVTAYYNQKILVRFNRPVDPVSGTNLANYNFNPGIDFTPTSVALTPDGLTAIVSFIDNGHHSPSYTLFVYNVREAAAPGNYIWPGTARPYAFVGLDPGLDDDGDGIPNGVELNEARDPFTKDNDVFAVPLPGPRLFAMQQYRDFLGREGDANGINYWTNLITSGQQTRPQVVQGFFASGEFQGTVSPVVRLYFAYFLRYPDYGGLLYHVGRYRAGTTLAAISQDFAASQEFIDRYGALNDSDFVELLYNNVLGRPSDPNGKAGWLLYLQQGHTRGEVMLGFSESNEFIGVIANETFVTMMYVGLLRRAPDVVGFPYWVNLLDTGTSPLDMTSGFISAQEYHDRFLY